MEPTELFEIISRDEDGKHQFKADFRNVDSLAAEMVAFSNSGGGQIFIGVADSGQIAGLTRDENFNGVSPRHGTIVPVISIVRSVGS